MNNFRKLNLIVGWLAFAVSAFTYLMTIEPTASLWDCGEFIATSYKLEVGHPPGAPLFMMIARIFTIFGVTGANAGIMVNAMSALCSAFTILFLFWTITHLARRLYGRTEEELTPYQTWAILGAGLIGSLAYTFTDTFWFSAVEGEVYAMSSLFTAVVFWAILKWENVADEPRSNRWLILIAYLMGLSIGVHILNLLAIPAIVMVYYFRKYPTVTAWGVVKALLVAAVILTAINGIIIPYSVLIGAWFDRMMNGMGMPINAGITIYVFLLFGLLIWSVWYTHKRGKVLLNTILLCCSVIMLGYGSYASVLIRASANPPMNSNNPDNPYALYSLLNRDQYGSRPLIKGPYYSSPPVEMVEGSSYFVGDDGKYHKIKTITGHKYAPGFEFLFPRMWSSREEHIEGYKRWVDIEGRKVLFKDRDEGENRMVTVPTFGENLQYFFSYQVNFMFVRYFMWNFVGRQSDVQSFGEITDGNWLSGIKVIDQFHLGPQDNLPDEMANNKARNTYYFLPFILGLIGLLYHLGRDTKNFTVVLMLFILMGVALVVYFNTNPSEPRERDYVFAGAFYAFCIWIGFGVMWLGDTLAQLFKKESPALAGVATLVCACVPVILCAQNWDDHDRSHRYVCRDIGWNYLESCLPNSIIMNYGDNDTFPLWYNQEVEDTRPDVRIMNMSYLMGDWYIDEMRVRSNESDAVPFSLPRSKYVNANDYIIVHDVFSGKAVDLRQAIDFIRSDDPRTRIELASSTTVDFLPAKRLALTVNKQNVLASGIVAEKDAELIVDTVFLNINKSTLDKGEMMFLDLLATFDWKRPLYFTQTQSLQALGLRDYLQFDGYAYRLVPIHTPVKSMANIGRIDPDYVYPLLMEKFRYGNVKDPRVYCDYFTRYNFTVSQTRNAFARLAVALVDRGDSLRAVEVLDRGMAEMPTRQIGNSYVQTIPVIEAYYTAGAMDKGDAMLSDYATELEQYIAYYFQFKGRKADLVADAFDDKLQHLGVLYSIARDYRRDELLSRIEAIFDRYTPEVATAAPPAPGK